MKLVLFCLLLFNLLQQFSITTDLMNHSSEHMLAVFTHYCNDNGNEFVVIVYPTLSYYVFVLGAKVNPMVSCFCDKKKEKIWGR